MKKGIRIVAAAAVCCSVLMSGVAPVLANSLTDQGSPKPQTACGATARQGIMQSPPLGMATVVDVEVVAGCAVRVSNPRFVPLASAPSEASNRFTATAKTLVATGATPSNASAAAVYSQQHGVYQRSWDCCGILMNELDTIAYWNYTGSSVTGWSVHNAVAYHRELAGGWWLQYQNAWLQSGNSWQENLAGNAGFSYQGLFDPSGQLYYNSYFNAIQVRGNGSWSCQWSLSWRNSFVGWHNQSWCS